MSDDNLFSYPTIKNLIEEIKNSDDYFMCSCMESPSGWEIGPVLDKMLQVMTRLDEAIMWINDR